MSRSSIVHMRAPSPDYLKVRAVDNYGLRVDGVTVLIAVDERRADSPGNID